MKYYTMFVTNVWSRKVNEKRQRSQLSRGLITRDCVDIEFHHYDMPKVFYPQESVGFCAILVHQSAQYRAAVRMTLGKQFRPQNSLYLPFRARLENVDGKGFRYVVVAFTGSRLSWECNYRQAMAEMSGGGYCAPPCSNTGDENGIREVNHQ